MMTRKLLENWTVWIVVDVVYVGMFICNGLYLTAANYAIYLVARRARLRRVEAIAHANGSALA